MKNSKKRNPEVNTRFERVDTRSFEAATYLNGKQISKCGIWLGNSFGSRGASSIMYSALWTWTRKQLQRKHERERQRQYAWIRTYGHGYVAAKKPLTNQGAAEYYWSMFFRTDAARSLKMPADGNI